MSNVVWFLVVFVAIGVGTLLVSHVAEGLRTVPEEPARLAWATDDMSVERADLGGIKVRYVKAGSGPDLVLLHTLRTQLDIYQDVIPELAKSFTVYAPDYPGHGWSDIPDAKYAPDDFYGWVEKFLDAVDVKDATIAGTSIGGTIALEMAARKNPRIAKAIAINPYDYEIAFGSGLKGSSFFGALMHAAVEIPVIGETFMRLRMQWMERMIFEGGVADNATLSDALYREMSGVGNRPGHLAAFISLIRHSQQWQEARNRYPAIEIPTLLIYGDQDWAPTVDRQTTANRVPGVKVVTLPETGHFLSLDKPAELAKLIADFARAE